MRFDFSSSQGGGWTGVDVTAPNLSITYTGLTSQFSSLLEYTTTVQTCESLGTCYVPPAIVLPEFLTPAKGAEPIELISEEEIKQIFKEEFAKVGLTEADIGMSDLDYKEVAKEINTQAVADMKEANPTLFGSPEPTSTTSSSTMNTTSDDKPTTKESSNVNSNSETTTKTSSTTAEKTETSTAKSTTSEDTKTEGSSSKTSSSENVSNEKGSTIASGTVNTSNATPKDEKISVNVKAAVDKVERELKSIGDKTKAIQEIKIDGNNFSLNVDLINNSVEIFHGRKKLLKRFSNVKLINTYKDQHLEIIKNKIFNICTFREGLDLIQLIEKIKNYA